MQTQTQSPNPATRDNCPDAHPPAHPAELWDAIERGIAENVRIILAPPGDPTEGAREEAGTRAARKIRALETAARVLERAEKARARINPLAQNPAPPLRMQPEAQATPRAPENEKPLPSERQEQLDTPPPAVAPAANTVAAPASATSDIPIVSCPQPAQPNPAPHISLPPVPECAKQSPSQTAPPAGNRIPKTPKALFPYTPPKTAPGSCLSEYLNIEDELPADPGELLALHRKATEFLGPAFNQLLQDLGVNAPSPQYASPRRKR